MSAALFIARLLVIALAALIVAGSGARAQGVVFANSDPLVTIHSTFTGQTMTLFGNVEPPAGEGPFDVIMVVRGPASDRIARLKDRQMGVMLNSQEAVYRRLPGYYAVLSSQPVPRSCPRSRPATPACRSRPWWPAPAPAGRAKHLIRNWSG